MSEIQTTLGALVNAEPVLMRLSDLRLPAKSAYHLAKLCKLVLAEVQHFHTERERIVKTLGEERPPTPDEAAQNGGTPVTEVTPENRGEFFRQLQELAAVDVAIAWKPLALEALAAVDVSADEVNVLGALLEE